MGGRREILLLAALAFLVAGCAPSAYRYRWDFFVEDIIHPSSLILTGLFLTVFIAVISQTMGVVLGVFGALGKMSKVGPVRAIANLYIWIFRGTPLLVQIMIVFYGLGVTGIYKFPDFVPLGPFGTGAVQAGILALGVNEGAYMAEIVRAGIISVDRGQNDAALALGMSSPQAMRRIILPQALRVILPPAGNQFISLLKATSLVSVIAGGDLLTAAENISSANLHTLELMLVATFWYLVLTTITSVGQHVVERRLGKAGVGMHGAR